ncbi:MAG: 2-oxoglutarate dehydrogenase complex dihydrolipoyllysine-residue succinyltransferase [Pseudobdellovibrionaceae bacterium]
MKFEVKLPTAGESVTEATIGDWMKKSGDYVNQNDPLLLVETDKASLEVVAEQAGVLEILVPKGKTIPVGSTVATIDTTAKASAGTAAPYPKPTAPPPSTQTQSAPPPQMGSQGGLAHPDLRAVLSPAVQKTVTEKNIDPTTVTGTGKGGRLTKEDVMKAPAGGAPSAAPTPQKAKEVPVALPQRSSGKQGQVTRTPMTTIRKKIAERLVQAQHTAAILTTFNEIDMSKLMDLRTRYKDKYKEKYGVNLGFMGFFVKAVIEGLRDWPLVNASIDKTDIVQHLYYNIGVAVGTEKGLIVPVIKDADQLSIAEIELAIKHYAGKARDGKITADDLSGGTFTISNGGVYGSLMSTPILNPPQSGILGMHKIEDRAVVIDKKVEVRPMMYIALSYDHRMVDGKEAVSFLVRVKECLEDPERILLEI